VSSPPAQPPPQGPGLPQIDCHNRKDGYYVKQPCQSSYVICAAGNSIVQNCPQGTVFHPANAACEFAAQCGQAQQQQQGQSNGGGQG